MPKNRIREITIAIEDPDHTVNAGGFVQAYVSDPHNGQGDPDPDVSCFWTGDIKREAVVDIFTNKTTIEVTYGTRWEDAEGKEVTPPWFAKCVERALQGFLRGRDEMDSDVAEEREKADPEG